MALFQNDATPLLKLGTQDVTSVFLGETKLWPNTPNVTAILFSRERLSILYDRIQNKVEPQWTAWQNVITIANQALTAAINAPADGIWYVPARYVDPDGHQRERLRLDKDANNAYTLALYAALTGSDPHAEKAVEIIRTWTQTVTSTPGVNSADTGLSWCYHFPAMIFAASLLKEHPAFSQSLQDEFNDYVTTFALSLSTADKTNNWGNWGVSHDIAIALYTNNQTLLTARVARWKDLLDEQITENGVMWAEITRNTLGDIAMWYSNFSLMPTTIAAEMLRNHGIDLFDYVSPKGRTLRMAYDRIAPWMWNISLNYFNPNQTGGIYMSWFEIVAKRWPNTYAISKLDSARPITANHTAPLLTFTHGEQLTATTPPAYEWIEAVAGSRPVGVVYQNGRVWFDDRPFTATEDRTVYMVVDRTAQSSAANAFGRATESTDTAGIAIRSGSGISAAYTLKVGFIDGEAREISETTPSAIGRHVICITSTGSQSSYTLQVDLKPSVTMSALETGTGVPTAHLNMYNQASTTETPIAGYYFRGTHSAQTRAAVIAWLGTEHSFSPATQ